MKKVMILGGYGFLGQNLNNVFKKSNYLIFNESRRSGCNILNLDELVSKLKLINPDFIINSSAHVGGLPYVQKYPADICHDNAQIYLNIYKAVNIVNPQIVVINPLANCSYPGKVGLQHENLWWEGETHGSVEAYGITKKIGYVLSKCYQKQHGIRTVNLIMPNAYGPLDYTDEERTHAMNGIIMRMIKTVRAGKTDFLVWGSGKPVREWIYIEDAARIIKIIIDKNLYNLPNPINLGQEFGLSINDSVNEIKKVLKAKINIINDEKMPDGAPIKILGKNKFRKHFPDFKFTSYAEGIKNTINYYKKIL